MLYTLNLHNVMCQLYLNKAGRKRALSTDPQNKLTFTSKSEEDGQEKQHNWETILCHLNTFNILLCWHFISIMCL